MMVHELEEFIYNGGYILRTSLNCPEALASPLLQEFFAVADYIAFNDPAVRSYLLGEQVSSKGRETAMN